MRWPWTPTERIWEPNHTNPIPDGDTVLAPSQHRWAELLTNQPQQQPVAEPTQQLPPQTSWRPTPNSQS